MMKIPDSVAAIQKDAVISGFTVVRVEDIPDMELRSIELVHNKSGARHLHLASMDSEKLFSVAFRTPPPDDTGLPHILEHSVLCGSRRYPLKELFVELNKYSMATYINASTYPDRTLYPCASMNHTDFTNLMRVYADAAFFPLLLKDHFRQEGHHFEILADGSLDIKGVVYNEMRGYYSDPDIILQRHIEQILFAGNAYSNDSGGDPDVIADLTFEDFVNFHKTYYHPSNSWILTYGDSDLPAVLDILDKEYLSKFEAMKIESTIKPLPRWENPKSAVYSYPIDKDEDPTRKTDVAVAFSTNDRRDLMETLAMKVISSYLLDNSASPLRKSLIDSKLGEELGGSGYLDWQRDTWFVVVLKGSEEENAKPVEDLCLDVLRHEVENGFNKEKVAASLRELELTAREIRPQYPLKLMANVFASWLYDSDPLSQLRVGQCLDDLHAAINNQPGYLEEIARKHLLDNPHRLRIALVPDGNFAAEKEKARADRLKRVLDGMSPAEKDEVRRVAKELEDVQSAPNAPEAVATLPRLKRSDVSPNPIPLEFSQEKAGGFDILDVKVQSGGIDYLQICLDLGYMDEELLDYLPLFAETLGKCGAAGFDYAEMAEREAACTGGVEFAAGITSHIDGPERARLRMTGWLKALGGDWPRALAVLADRMFKPEFTDKNRLKDIVLQSRIGWRNQIVPMGSRYAGLYSSQYLNPAAALSERLDGCTQARFVERLAESIDANLDTIIDRFEAIRHDIAARAVLYASQVGSRDAFGETIAWLDRNAPYFKRDKHTLRPPMPEKGSSPRRIGLAASSDVNYVAAALPAPPEGSPDSPALRLLGEQLTFGYLWNEIRIKGGAYGVGAVNMGARGAFQLYSFRDPSINRTLDIYGSLPNYVATQMDLSPEEVEQAIIGTIKTLDHQVRASSAAPLALMRWLGGETEEFRRKYRSTLLGLTAADVKKAADTVFKHLADAPICVMSNREKLSAENMADNSRTLVIESLWDAEN